MGRKSSVITHPGARRTAASQPTAHGPRPTAHGTWDTPTGLLTGIARSSSAGRARLVTAAPLGVHVAPACGHDAHPCSLLL